MKRTKKLPPRLASRLEGRRLLADRRNTVEVTRLKGQYTAFGYHSAGIMSKDGRSATPGSGDSHAIYDRLRLLDQAREFMRDNGIFSGMIERGVSYIVGNGFGLQARTEDEAWNREAERYWREEFWQTPDIRGLQSGPGLEREICREMLVAGDVGAIKVKGGKLQVIEAEQVRGQTANDDGLVRAENGAIIGYWVSPYGPTGAVQTAKARKLSTEDFLFLTRPERPSMARAVPPCQSSFPMLHRIKDVCDSEAIAWQMLARIAIMINRSSAGTLAFQTSQPDDAKSDTEGNFASRVHELDQALIFHGELGEEIKGVERNIPGKDFTASLMMFIRLGGLPLGFPLEVILLDWTKSNYSQSRAVLEQFHTSFQCWQVLIEHFFHRKVYRWAIELALASHRLAPPAGQADPFRHEWIKPTFPWIDQLKETEAYGAKLDRSFCTHSEVLRGLGRDREEVLTGIELEIRDAIARSKKIEAETGVKVPWEPFAGKKAEAPAPTPTPGATPAPAEKQEPEEGDEESRQKVSLDITLMGKAPVTNVTNEITVNPTPVHVDPTPFRVEVQPAAVLPTPVTVLPAQVTVESKPEIHLPPPVERKSRKKKTSKGPDGSFITEEID